MPKKHSYITATDQFCGAGGSSQGATKAGVEVRLAINHWRLAIETHNSNFPGTIHECTDISACDPRRYPSTDILITSPECTNHSIAKGVKIVKKQMDLFNSGKVDPAAERSRATMWDVPRFAEYHNYNAIIVENVVDVRKWGMFESWLHAMYALGYFNKCVYLNSMHCHPTPQSRDRIYIVFWKKGNKTPKLDYTPLARCPKCDKDVNAVQSWKDSRKQYGKYRQQYLYCCPKCSSIVEPYYCAFFNCIDWSDIGTKIGDRKKALSPKTITRIKYGIEKYCKPIIHAHGTIKTKDGHGLLTTAIKCAAIIDSAGCLTSVNYLGIVTNEYCNSFISYYYGNSQSSRVSEPLRTVSTKERGCIISNISPVIEDCYYRMLKPNEIKLAMAFDKKYIVLGSGKNQVRQLGNAVTPPVMEWLVKQIVESLK